MKRTVTCLKNLRKSLILVLLLSSVNSNLNAQCTGVVVTPPTIDVRGNLDLCINSRLELCPAVWGYSNYQWYKDGVALSTSSCITVSESGSYTLAGQDGSGCWSVQSTVALVTGGGSAPSTPIISTSSSTTFCSGGSATLSSSASTGNQWFRDGLAIQGAINQNYIARESGTYSVAASNCGIFSSASNDIVVTVNPTPSVNQITGSSNVCVGQTAQLSNTTNGGTWSSSDNLVATIDANGLVSAISTGAANISYIVTSLGCTTVQNFAIQATANTTPVIEVRGNTNLCIANSLDLCPQQWGYSNYEWYKDGVLFSTSGCITVTAGGIYTLRGQNGSTCWSALSTAVSVTGGTVPTTPTISTLNATTFCSGSSATLSSTISTGYQWYKDGILINGATNQTYSATASGIYTVRAVNCGASSVTSNDIVITVNASPNVAQTTGTSNICLGATTQLANDSVGGIWSSSNNLIATVDANGLVSSVAVGSTNIIYTITSGGCSTASTLLVNVINNASLTPVIQVNGSTSICNNSSTSLCPTDWGASGYNWFKDGVAFSTSSCITITSAGSYTLQTQNGSSCLSALSSPVNITVGTAPTATIISADSSTSFCNGGSVILSSTVAVNYQWQKDGVNINGAIAQTYLATTSGDYTVVVSGCGTATSNLITVTADVAPTVANISGGSTVCPGLTTLFTNATLGGTWSSSDNSIATIDNNGLITGIAQGTTTISYTVANGSCTTVKTRTITVFAPAITPIINPRSAITFCQGGSVMLCPLNFGYSNYNWYKDGILFSTASCFTTNQGGIYTLSAQSGAGCWSDLSSGVTVTVNPLPIVDATAGLTSVCTGSNITLINSTVIPMGGSATWSSTAGRATVNSNTGVVTGINVGSANIRYTVTNSFTCRAFVDYAVTINALPAIPSIAFAPGTPSPAAPSGGYCTNRTFTLLGIPSGGTWSNTGVISVTAGGEVSTGTIAGVGSVAYSITNANGCVNTRTISNNVVVCAPRGLRPNSAVLNSDNEIVVYPNPAKSFIQIQLNKLVGKGDITIADLTGKVIHTQILSLGTNTIDITNLSNGMYFVTYTSNNERVVKRFIKN
jgi:uncharacterized protein YjdB